MFWTTRTKKAERSWRRMEVEDVCVRRPQEAAAGDDDLGGRGRDEAAGGGNVCGRSRATTRLEVNGTSTEAEKATTAENARRLGRTREEEGAGARFRRGAHW